MSHNASARPIEIAIGNQSLTFCSLADFEFCLAGRTAVPAKKTIHIAQFSADKLKEAANTIKKIENRLTSILSQSIEEPDSLNQAIGELSIFIFSRDHAWRTIMLSLRDSDDAGNEFRHVALVKYMQYLASLQEITRCLYFEKKKYQNKMTRWDENDLSFPDFQQYDENDLERMPKGETITLAIKQNEQIELLLSRNRCALTSGDSILFIDAVGEEHALSRGRNTIGRDKTSNVIMNPAWRDISRLHLIIDIDTDNRVHLTDLSSHGSYIATKHLQHDT